MELKKIKFFLGLSFLWLSLNINAQEVIYKNVKINFSEEWKTQENTQKQLIAFSPEKDTLILSVVYPPTVNDGQRALIVAQNSIDALENIIPNVQVIEREKLVTSANGIPVQFTQYLYKVSEETRFLIGATIATNAGIVLITFEGKGDDKQSVDKFNNIINHIRISKPEAGLLFNQGDILQ